MKKIAAIYGPYQERLFPNLISWSFAGVRESGEPCGWTLRFHFRTRRFSSRAVRTMRSREHAAAVGQGDMLLAAPIGYRPLPGQKITDALQSRLSPEQVARATVLAMTGGR